MSTNNKFEVSNRVFTIIIIALAGLVLFWAFRMYEIWNTSHGYYPREISVEATGKAYVVPDVAKVNLGVNTQAPTAEAAVEENNKKMNTIMAEIEKTGVEKKDIKTTNYYLNPKYGYTPERGEYQDGFTLDQTVEVTVRDFEKIGEVLAVATKNGANTINNLNFTVDDPDNAKTQAREEAIAKAKEKAKEIAKQSGLKLGRVINYYEYEDVGVYPEYMAMDSYKAEGMGGAPVPPEIVPGEKEISLRVTLSYRVY